MANVFRQIEKQSLLVVGPEQEDLSNELIQVKKFSH